MGIVYLGRDAVLKRLVTIKALNPEVATSEAARLRFAREAEAAAAIDHPNVVNIYQVGTLPASGVSYFIMQFVEGRTLGETFPPGQPAPNAMARRVLGEVASALAAAHAKGLAHRDIKPANVIIEAPSGRAIVVDFGISAVLDRAQPDQTASPKITSTGMYVGTPSHTNPEQAAGEPVSDRSDAYSLGAAVGRGSRSCRGATGQRGTRAPRFCALSRTRSVWLPRSPGTAGRSSHSERGGWPTRRWRSRCIAR